MFQPDRRFTLCACLFSLSLSYFRSLSNLGRKDMGTRDLFLWMKTPIAASKILLYQDTAIVFILKEIVITDLRSFIVLCHRFSSFVSLSLIKKR